MAATSIQNVGHAGGERASMAALRCDQIRCKV
jgi:hypothetical protein